MANPIVLKAAKVYFVILSCYIVGICVNGMTFKFRTVIGALFVSDTISSYKRFLPVRNKRLPESNAYPKVAAPFAGKIRK